LRASCDASIYTQDRITRQEVGPSDDFNERFLEAYMLSNEEERGATISDYSFYGCTGEFATRGEQQDSETMAVPCLCISTRSFSFDDDDHVIDDSHVSIVTDMPMPMPLAEHIPGLTSSMSDTFADRLNHRVAGFTFRDAADDMVEITYVESALNDLETLSEKQKDALLVDRALVVHRVIAQITGATEHGQRQLPQTVKTLYAKPEASGMPPSRTVSLRMGVHRADPRHPLKKPNSCCLECGKEPKKENGLAQGELQGLFKCSKCHVRKFCSRECHAKSWKSSVWSHRTECNAWAEHEQWASTGSLRDHVREAVASGQIPNMGGDAEAIIEQLLGKTVIDEASDNVDDARAKEKARQKKNRQQNRKKKGRGKKK